MGIGIAISMALFGLQMLTNKDVIKIAKQLVKNIDNHNELTGQEKTEAVLAELKIFFGDLLPIILEAVIKIAVLDMQNKSGVLATKLKEQSENK